MTKTAVWCRHVGDNVIGIGSRIPWNVASDRLFFRTLAAGQNLVMGRKTYESFPADKLEAARLFVLTANAAYEPAEKSGVEIVTDIRLFKDFEEDLYIAGGAEVYRAFLTGGAKLMPDIIVDCVYGGSLDKSSDAAQAEITSCVEIMAKSYRQISEDNELDGVVRAIFVRKGEFIEQSALKRIVQAMERKN